jgi:hypothetical protein
MTIKIVKKVLTIEIIPVILKEKEPTCITIICPETFKPPPVTLQIPLPVMEQLGQKLGSSDYSEPKFHCQLWNSWDKSWVVLIILNPNSIASYGTVGTKVG